MKSLGPKEWEKCLASGFRKLFEKECNPSVFFCYLLYIFGDDMFCPWCSRIHNQSHWWREIPFTREYELSRRDTQRYVWEQWIDFKEQMSRMKDNSILDEIREEFLEVLARLEAVREMDSFDKYRTELNGFVSNLIQKKLWANQNPKDCSKARKLVCIFVGLKGTVYPERTNIL